MSNVTMFPSVAAMTADQMLVIRCNYFNSEQEVKAFLEGLGCGYGEYLELKQRYRAGLEELNGLSRQDQIKRLNEWGFESAIVDDKTQTD